MRKSFYYSFIKVLLLTVTISLSSCSKDDNGLVYHKDDVVGEWFFDKTQNGQVNYALVTLSADGKFSDWEVRIGVTDDINILGEGTYTYDGKVRFTYTTKYDPIQYYQEWTITTLTNYTMAVTEKRYSNQGVFHRVVDTYTVAVGENRQWSFSAPDFYALSYHSCNDKVATVDDEGMIHAVKRGTTYIRAISGTEEVVIRVVVNDSDNVIDDYTKYIGKSVDQIVTDLGSPYLEHDMDNGMMNSSFRQDDEFIRNIGVYYFLREHAYEIIATFQDRVDIQPVIDFFDAKYIKHESSNEHHYVYTAINNGVYVTIQVDDEYRNITYRWDQDGIEEFDGMILTSIDNLTAWFGLDLSKAEDGYLSCEIDNGLYEMIDVMFDEETREIYGIQLMTVSGISFNAVINWFKERYYEYVGNYNLLYFITTRSFPRSEYYVRVTIESATQRVYVTYLRNQKQ